MGHHWIPKIVLTLCLFSMELMQPSQAAASDDVQVLQTSSGIRFGIMGTKPSAPAPTLFIFAFDIEGTLASETYSRIGTIVGQHGYLCVSMDLPFHPGSELDGWADATKKGEAWVAPFVSKVSEVLDHLIKEGYTDPQKVAMAGTSRGGFMAMQVAAGEPRVKCAIGFVPVTELTDLAEFSALKEDPSAKALSLANIVEKLSGRSIFISIGNNDDRVNTDRAIEFTRKLVVQSIATSQPQAPKKIDVELHVMPWLGHGGMDVLTAHDVAAAWLLARWGKEPDRQAVDVKSN